jgi:hypothetical protein
MFRSYSPPLAHGKLKAGWGGLWRGRRERIYHVAVGAGELHTHAPNFYLCVQISPCYFVAKYISVDWHGPVLCSIRDARLVLPRFSKEEKMEMTLSQLRKGVHSGLAKAICSRSRMQMCKSITNFERSINMFHCHGWKWNSESCSCFTSVWIQILLID